MARRVVLVCDKCGSSTDVFAYGLRPVGGAAQEFQGDLCRSCYLQAAKDLRAKRGKPTRGNKQPMVALDYDTGEPLEFE